MLTIPIKIKREDKAIMVRLLENIQSYPFDFSDLDKTIIYETYIELLSKLRASLHNDKPIRLNLVQTKVFLSFINQVYSAIGSYEMANTHRLDEYIRKEIYKKASQITK